MAILEAAKRNSKVASQCFQWNPLLHIMETQSPMSPHVRVGASCSCGKRKSPLAAAKDLRLGQEMPLNIKHMNSCSIEALPSRPPADIT